MSNEAAAIGDRPSRHGKLLGHALATIASIGRRDAPMPIPDSCLIDGVRQQWDESHDPQKPRWLGGDITGIAHRRCNRLHNNQHDTPKYAKNNRQRQRNIGAKVSLYRPIIGTFRSGIKLSLRPFSRPIDRKTGREL